ncbi:Pfs and NB-ARC domain protein [Aspergillus thermomutatus]|uniref:Nucleoside phosphorylase domain-containing protein n=1 Tax=Aspergillus thermomutatus TaxID=41047 RepID=A0A397G6R9_ASPTH|nr:uncharacterized protein CDV56_100819 [Aspergillus thermomutatus]RHZ45308.1 hypothetical protein CDV56_100819 [Aspergillus thermomutatus]
MILLQEFGADISKRGGLRRLSTDFEIRICCRGREFHPKMRLSSRDEFEIAILCALPLEVNAVEALLDETYNRIRNEHMKDNGDVNAYTTGRIGKQNIVLCHMPGMGKVSAAGVATSLRFSYPNIRLALLVGICGGVPFPSSGAAEIFLGDVIISDSLIEYDFGKQYPGGFQRKTGVGRPNREIRTILSAMASSKVYSEFEEQLNKHLDNIQAQDKRWMCPGVSLDVLFESSYRHQHRTNGLPHHCDCANGNSVHIVCDEALKSDCSGLGCDETHLRRRRSSAKPTNSSVHIGTFACADTVMKSGEHRDLLAKREGVIGLEMEGAGIWDNTPCVIIKGVCDYADSHKSKVWQSYAAATAAAGAKAFLGYWVPSTKAELRSVQKAHMRIPIPKSVFFGRKVELEQMEQNLGRPERGRKGVALWGLSGYGKTQLAIHYIAMHKPTYDSILWIDSSSADSIHESFAQVCLKLGKSVYQGHSAVDKVLEWLEQDLNRSWIIVFDGVDDCEDANEPDDIDLRKYIPSCDHGHVLLTTISSDLHLRLNFAGIQVNGVDEQAGSEILMRCSGSTISNSSAPMTAKAISRRVGGVPLALEQAGSFLSYGFIFLNEYNRHFDRQFAETTFKTPLRKNFGSYEKGRTLWTAFEMLYDALSKRSSDSVRLLHLLAFLGRGQIPLSAISNLVSQRGKSPESPDSSIQVAVSELPLTGTLTWLLQLQSQRDGFTSALRDLETSGFVKFNRKRSDTVLESFFIHDMVRSFVRLRLSKEDILDNAASALLLLGNSCSNMNSESRLDSLERNLGRLSSVLEKFLSLVSREMLEPPHGRYFELCGSVAPVYARVCRLNGDLERAKSLWIIALQYRSVSQGNQWPSTPMELQELLEAADTDIKLGCLEDGIEKYRSLLARCEGPLLENEELMLRVVGSLREAQTQWNLLKSDHNRAVAARSFSKTNDDSPWQTGLLL